MRIARLAVAAALTGAAIVSGAINADVSARNEHQVPIAPGDSRPPAGAPLVHPIGGSVGPDLICGSVGGTTGIVSWGQDTAGQIVAYSFGVTGCNIGSAPVFEDVFSSNHTLEGANVFRLHGGCFEQVGQSWLKHGFCALQQSICGTCTPFCGGCCDHLGVGCSDPYSALRQGEQTTLGPKSGVNPATGITTASYSMPVPAPGDTSGHVHGRVQIHKTDLYQVNYPGARYFAEAQHLAADDAAAGNDDNNASWREVTFAQPASPAAFPTHMFNALLIISGSGAVSGTNREEVALLAWPEFDTNPDNIVPVTLVNADVANDGRFIFGYKVLDNHDGTYTYEYALENFNSDRSGQALTIPVGSGANVSNIGFHDVDYHSANGTTVPIYSGADWTSVIEPASITWFTDTFAVNPNANALRWGTLYNFRFTSVTAPVPINATLNLFKPGSPANIVVPTVGPGNGTPIGGDLNGDGLVNTLDLGILLASWTIPPAVACAPPCPADLNGDGVVNTLDLGVLLSGWTL